MNIRLCLLLRKLFVYNFGRCKRQPCIMYISMIRPLNVHLGNHLKYDTDVNKTTGYFISSVNRLVAKLGFVQSNVLNKLFCNYCCSFYGSQAWDLCCTGSNKRCVAWHTAIKHVRRLPTRCHTRPLRHICRRIYIRKQMIGRFVKCYHRMINCNNVMKCIAKKADGHSSGPIDRDLSMLRSEYNLNPNCISRDVFVRLSEDEEERYTGAFVRDLCYARDGVCFLDISKENINTIIDTACIM